MQKSAPKQPGTPSHEPKTTRETALEEARTMVATARQTFQERVNKVLLNASDDAYSLSQAIGEVSIDEAYDAWVRNLLEDAKKQR
jgi:hypothetical protein